MIRGSQWRGRIILQGDADTGIKVQEIRSHQDVQEGGADKHVVQYLAIPIKQVGESLCILFQINQVGEWNFILILFYLSIANLKNPPPGGIFKIGKKKPGGARFFSR